MKPTINHATVSNLAGIDIAQLLRDIGEASASTDPVELFRLCLDAQRVLVHVQAGAVNLSAPGESKIIAAYRAMNDRSRLNMQAAMQAIARAFPRQRHLALVQSGQANRGEAV